MKTTYRDLMRLENQLTAFFSAPRSYELAAALLPLLRSVEKELIYFKDAQKKLLETYAMSDRRKGGSDKSLIRTKEAETKYNSAINVVADRPLDITLVTIPRSVLRECQISVNELRLLADIGVIGDEPDA